MADYDEEDFEEDFEEEELEEEELSDGDGFGAKPAAQPPPSKAAAPASKPSPSKMMGGFQPSAMLEAASSDDDGSVASIKSASSGRSTTKPPPRQQPPAAKPKAAEPDIDDMLGNFDAMLKGYQSAQPSKPEPPPAAAKPPSSESGRDKLGLASNAKLDNLLAGLEADVAETEKARQRLVEKAPSPPPPEPTLNFVSMGAGQGATAADAGPARCGRRGGGGGGGGDTASLFGEAPSAGRPAGRDRTGNAAEAEPNASHSNAPLEPPGRQEGGPALGRRAAGRRGAPPPTTADDALSNHFPNAAALGAPPPAATQGAPSWLRDDPPKPSQKSPRPGKGALPWEPAAETSPRAGKGAAAEKTSHVGSRTGSEKPHSEKPAPRKHDFSAVSQPAAAPKKISHDFSGARGVDAAAPPAAPSPPKPAGSGKARGASQPKRGGKKASQPPQPPQHANHAAPQYQPQPQYQPEAQQPPRGGGGPKPSRPRQSAPHAPPPGGEARAMAHRASAEAGAMGLDGLAQANTTLEAQLRQLQRQLQKARAQGEALDAQHGEQRATRPRGEQRGGAKGRPSRPGSSASIDPAERQHVEARQLANAQKQLAYYTRESEMLHKKMARVRSVDHLSVLEATVAAKQTALEEARRRGRELAREAKEQDRRLDNCVRGVEDPSKELASLGEDVRVARKHAARLVEDNARDARELKKGSALAADVEAEVAAAQSTVDAGAGARAVVAERAARAATERAGQAAALLQQAAEETAGAGAEHAEHRQQLARTQQQVKMLNTEVLALEGHLKRKEREALELKIKLKKEERREQRRSSLEAQESAAQLW